MPDNFFLKYLAEEIVKISQASSTDKTLKIENFHVKLGDTLTLEEGKTYVLEKPLIVDGTLEIEKGVTVYAKPYTRSDLSDTVYILINKTGKINAVGTEENPIIFRSDIKQLNYSRLSSSENGSHHQVYGSWGGIIITGNGGCYDDDGQLTEVRWPNYFNETIENDIFKTIKFGSTNTNKSSGKLDYIIIKHAGINFEKDSALLDGGNIVPPLLLLGVTDETKISNIFISESIYAIDLIGGDVDLNFMYFDTIGTWMYVYNGWSGVCKNIFGKFKKFSSNNSKIFVQNNINQSNTPVFRKISVSAEKKYSNTHRLLNGNGLFDMTNSKATFNTLNITGITTVFDNYQSVDNKFGYLATYKLVGDSYNIEASGKLKFHQVLFDNSITKSSEQNFITNSTMANKKQIIIETNYTPEYIKSNYFELVNEEVEIEAPVPVGDIAEGNKYLITSATPIIYRENDGTITYDPIIITTNSDDYPEWVLKYLYI